MLRTTGLPLAFLGLLLVLCSSAVAETKQFGMEDLKALAAQKSWAELYEHLQDITPSARSAEWNELAEQAASAQVTSAADPETAFSVAEDATKKFPFLVSSDSFTAILSSAALAHFERCLRDEYNSQDCLDRFFAFIKANKSNSKLAFAAGGLVLKTQNHAAAVRFYELALSNGKGVEGCSDEGVWDALASGLSLPPTDAVAGIARDLTFKRCWPAVQEQTLGAFAKESPKSYFMQNTCKGLLEKNAVSGLQAKMCTSLTKE